MRWNQIEIQINFALECLTGETCAKPQLLGQNSHLDAKVFLKLHSDIPTDPVKYFLNLWTPKETKRVENCYNAYCQFSQQACTNFMQTYLHSFISTHFFVLTTNLHWFVEAKIVFCVMSWSQKNDQTIIPTK